MNYTLEMFLNAVTNDAPYELYPSPYWSEDPWYKDEENCEWNNQDRYLTLQPGEAEGKLIGEIFVRLICCKGQSICLF